MSGVSDKRYSDLTLTALRYLKAGLAVIPVSEDKRPAVRSWKQYHNTAPTEGEVYEDFDKKGPGIAAIGGRASGGLECIDFDLKYDITGTLMEDYTSALEEAMPGLTDKIVMQRTPSGGYHMLYRCSAGEGNLKLAMRPPTKAELAENPGLKSLTLIETRGQGGYFLIDPSPNYMLLNGKRVEDIAQLTDRERSAVVATARMFNTFNVAEPSVPKMESPEHGGTAPGDDYDAKADIVDLLLRHGWKLDRSSSAEGRIARLTRPGKDKGVSATWNAVPDRFYVFSSNASPFESCKVYRKWHVFALLECGGDFAEAAKKLYDMGYGERHRADDIDIVEQIMASDQAKSAEFSAEEKETICRAFVEEYEEEGIERCMFFLKDKEWRGKYAEYIKEKRERRGWKAKYKTICDFYDICDRHDIPVKGIRVANIFWHATGGERPKLQFKLHKLTSFLNYHGFYKYYQDDVGFKYVRSYNNRVRQVTPVQIKEFVIKYIEDKVPLVVATGGGKEFTKADLMEAMKTRLKTLFGGDLMETLSNIQASDFMCSTADANFFYFENGVVKVSARGWEFRDYSSVKKLIWENQIAKRKLGLPYGIGKALPDMADSVFYKFVKNICRTRSGSSEARRFDMLTTIIGYLLHDYHECKKKAIAFTDEASTDEEANGRSGKSLLCEGIGKMRSVVLMDGKDYDHKDRFKWQEISYDTQIICIDDAKRGFPLENLFHNITQGVSINKKQIGSFKIATKFVITINSVVRGQGGSVDDRLAEFAFSDHYSAKHSPLTEFGHWFFSDWDQERWDYFFVFMIECAHKYFVTLKGDKTGVGIVMEGNDTLGKRHIVADTDMDFIEFMEMVENGDMRDLLTPSQSIELNKKLDKNYVYEKFLEIFPDHKTRMRKTMSRQFTFWVRKYCKYRQWELLESKSNGKCFYEIITETPF